MAKKLSEDLNQRFISKMRACRPKKGDSGMFDVVNSNDLVLGDINYVLLTGIDDFDEFSGGFPFGRISEVFGLENCGKSALVIRSMCRFQAKHIYEVVDKKGFIYSLRRVPEKNVRIIQCYIDNEGSLEKGFKLGITDITFNDMGEEVIETTMMEGIGLMRCDTVEHVFLAAQNFLEIINDAEIEEEDKAEKDDKYEPKIIFGVFIVDTVAGTSSKAEIEREWHVQDYPRAAAKYSEGFRRLTNDFNRHNVAAIFTNQVRNAFKERMPGAHKIKFSTPQADDFSTFGGKALSFYSTHRIFMFQVPQKYTLVKGAQFPAGFLIGFRTVKNRLRKPLREARMVLLFDEEQGGLHNIFSILESLIFLKVADYGKDGSISFKFRKFGVETTSFAENVVLQKEGAPKPEAPARRRKREEDPSIDGRYQWLAFYKAHRLDLEKLHDVAIKRANAIEGLDPFYEPDPDAAAEDEEEEFEPRRRNGPEGRMPLPGLADHDL